MAQTLGIDWNVRLVDGSGTGLLTSTTINDAIADTVVGPVVGSIPLLYDAGTPDYNRIRSANNLADGAAGGTFMPVANVVYNGTTFDRMRTASGDSIASTGLSAAANMLHNASGNWSRAGSISGIADGASGITAQAAGLVNFNGSTFDKNRNNIDVTLLASAARTTTQTSADITTYNARGIHVVLDMTTVGTGSVTVTINGKDSVSGKYYLLLSGAAVTTNSTNVYKVYPGLTAAANASANDHIPRVIQIVVTANNANSAVYSCGYCLLV